MLRPQLSSQDAIEGLVVLQHLILAGAIHVSSPGSFIPLATRIEANKLAWLMEVWGWFGGKVILCFFEKQKEHFEVT